MSCRQLTDEDLELFLLQLVQALRYEEDPYRKEEKQITVERVIRMVKQKSSEVSPITLSDESPVHSEPENEPSSELAQPVNETASKDVSLSSEGGMIDGSELSNSVVEDTMQPSNPEPEPEPESEAKPEPEPEVIDDVIEGTIQEVQTVTVITPVSPLLQFLVNRCSVKRSLASLFIRYLRVEATTKGNDSDNASRIDQGGDVRTQNTQTWRTASSPISKTRPILPCTKPFRRKTASSRSFVLLSLVISSSSDSATALASSVAARRRSRRICSCCCRAIIARSSATIRCCRSVPSCRCRTCCLLPRRYSSPR